MNSDRWYKRRGYGFLYGSTLTEMKWQYAWIFSCLLDEASCSCREGYVLARKGEGHSIKGLSYNFRTPEYIIKEALPILVNNNKIEILDNNIIKIVNWNKYQSEYNRTKKYINKPEPNQEPNQEPTNWKKNYAIGMQKERDNDKLKEELKDEREQQNNSQALSEAKDCYLMRDFDGKLPCYGEHPDDDKNKPLFDKCKMCLIHRASFKKSNAVNDYHNCEFYIDKECYIKNHGTKTNKKYDFCYTCAWDKVWGEGTGKWGNSLVTEKWKPKG